MYKKPPIHTYDVTGHLSFSSVRITTVNDRYVLKIAIPTDDATVSFRFVEISGSAQIGSMPKLGALTLFDIPQDAKGGEFFLQDATEFTLWVRPSYL